MAIRKHEFYLTLSPPLVLIVHHSLQFFHATSYITIELL